jgi:hypothetical protein
LLLAYAWSVRTEFSEPPNETREGLGGEVSTPSPSWDSAS